MPTQREFSEAFRWMFGSTWRGAAETYKEMKRKDPQYIETVVAVYRKNSRDAFYND